MPDRLSIMLDSMMSAVDNGLSYDGIVSVPEIGLEDYGRRPGLVGRFDDGVELFWRTGTAVSWAMGRFFHRSAEPTPERQLRRRDVRELRPSPPHGQAFGELKRADTGTDPGAGTIHFLISSIPGPSAIHTDAERLPRRRDMRQLHDPPRPQDPTDLQTASLQPQGSFTSESSRKDAELQVLHDVTSGDTEKLPSRVEEQDPIVGIKPLMKDELLPEYLDAAKQLTLGGVTHPTDVDQSLPRAENEGAIPESTSQLSLERGRLPRRREDFSSEDDQDGDEGGTVGGLTHPTTVSPSAENEGAIPGSSSQLSFEQGRSPRRREVVQTSENDQDDDEARSS